MQRLYGIPNCDTVKKARKALAEAGLAVDFVDVKKTGVPQASLARWMAVLGWEALVNRRGTTWRGLPASEQAAVVDPQAASAALVHHSSLLKRPVVEWSDGVITVGFEAAAWAARVAAVRQP